MQIFDFSYLLAKCFKLGASLHQGWTPARTGSSPTQVFRPPVVCTFVHSHARTLAHSFTHPLAHSLVTNLCNNFFFDTLALLHVTVNHGQPQCYTK